MRHLSASDEPEHRISIRHSILAVLPIPSDIPDDALKPILIPAPFTLHEFLGNTTGVSPSCSKDSHIFAKDTRSPSLSKIRALHSVIHTLEPLGLTDFPIVRLANYRVFHQLTTSWCPQREEHGYLLTPVFKCSTNPRVATAHRWTAVDVLGRMNKPTGKLISLGKSSPYMRHTELSLIGFGRMLLQQRWKMVLCRCL